MKMNIQALAAMAAAGTILAAPAGAAEFYKGKQITLIISAGAGGGYGAVGQVVTRHWPKFIPGKPTMVPQYMGKAGGVVAANYLYHVANKNGTVIGLLRNATAFGQAMGAPGLKYDVRKFNWLGSTGPLINVLGLRNDAPVNSLKAMRKSEVILGGTGRLGTLFTFPTTLHKLLGYKSKIILGYRGTSDVRGALDRNEVQGMVQPWPNWARGHFLKMKIVTLQVQFGYERLADLPNIPTMIELARTDDERKMARLVTSPAVTGRNFAAPPGMPVERVEIMRAAFNKMVKDPAYKADMKKRRRMDDPKDGAQLKKLIDDVLATPKPLVNQVRAILGYK